MIDVVPVPEGDLGGWRTRAEQRLLARLLKAGVHETAARRSVERLVRRADELTSEAWAVRRDGTAIGTAWTLASRPGPALLLDLDVPVEDAREVREVLAQRLRTDGATQLAIHVPTGDAARAGAVDGLDVPLEATQMQLDLALPVGSPPRVHLVPMTPDEYAGYRDHLVSAFGDDLFAAGAYPDLEAAQAASEQSTAELLPDGPGTPGHHLWSAFDQDTAVAILWIHVDAPVAFIYDIEVHADHRRRGYGREVLDAGALAARELGAEVLGLNVFGPNDGARALYERAGYATTERSYRVKL